MATTVARLEAILGADTGQFDRAMNKSESRIKSMGKVAALGGLAIAGGIAVGLKKSVDAAMESEKAQARLNQALKGAGVSQQQYGKQIEANIQKTSRLAALDDEDLSDSFAKLVRATGDVSKATEGMNLAADIARSRNISLEAATKMTERALIGNAAAFSRVGVAVVKSSDHLAAAKLEIDSWRDSSGKLTDEETAKSKALMDTARTLDKQATAAKAFDVAQRKFADGAKEYGETAAGAQERFGVAVENLQEKIGTKLLPILAKLAEWSLKVIESIEKNWPKIMQIIGPTLDRVKAFVQQFAADMQQIWDKHGKQIMAIVTFVFNTIKTTIENALKVIGGVIDVVMGLLTGDWRRAWDGIKNIVGGILDQVEHLLRTAITIWATIGKKIGTAIKDAIVEGFTGIGQALWQKILDAVDWVKSKIPSLPKIELNPLKWGDARDPNMTLPSTASTFSGSLMGANPEMAPFAAGAASFGLRVTSGLRPGAITANGTMSDHAIGKALDVAGSSAGMAAFFRSLIGSRFVKQAFYDPLGSIFGGILSSYREGGHSDHVHVATYDQGGYLRPGWNLAYNGTGALEPVGGAAGGPSTIVVQVGTDTLARLVRNAKGKWEQQNGRAF